LIRRLLPDPEALDGSAGLEAAYDMGSGPCVRADFVTSLDGAIEIGGRSGGLGGAADRAAFMAMRAAADVILVGAGTARAENYGPVVLDAGASDRRRNRGQTASPRLAVVTARGDLPGDMRMFAGSEPPVVITTARGLDSDPDLAGRAEVAQCGDVAVDMELALGVLGAMGLARVLCEGGPALLRSLLDRDLLDELCLTISPVVAGPQHRRLSGEDPLEVPARFRLLSLLEGDGMLLARYGRPS